MKQELTPAGFSLQVSHIKKSYKRRQDGILKDISFTAHAGECIGILGVNGCGKSTLLSILAGIQKPDSGTLTIQKKEENAPTPVIGYVPQENPLIEELTALDNLKLWYSNSPKNLKEELEHGTLSMLGIPDFLHTRVKQMSGGMKKRLNIGCAMACDPQILLLDEPGAALDLPCKEQINHYLSAYQKAGNLVLIATHEESEINLCNRLLLFQNGTLMEQAYDGNLKQLMELLTK